MMYEKIAQEYDPLLGLTTIYGATEKKFTVTYLQDIAPALDHAQNLRNDDDYKRLGIKNNFQHTVHLPDSVCLKMRTEDGIDPYTCSAKELRNHLVKNKDKYGHLFVTRGKF